MDMKSRASGPAWLVFRPASTDDHERGCRRGAIRGISVLVALGVVVVGIAGCGGGSSKASLKSAKSAPTTAAPATAPMTSTTTVETKILADLAAYYDAFGKAVADPDPKRPDLLASLEAHVVGEDLNRDLTFVAQLNNAHKAIRGPLTSHPRVLSITGASAVVDDCVHIDDHYYSWPGGQLLPGSPDPAVSGSEFTLVLDGGTWKVSQLKDKASACSA